MNTIELLKTLSGTFGPSGFESEVRDTLHQLVKPLVDEVQTDTLGNLIAIRHGQSTRKIMLDAHMDEVGFMISHIEEDGFLRLAPLGGWDARILPSHAVMIQARDGKKVRGIIGSVPPHVLTAEDRAKPIELVDLFVDVGVDSAKDIEALNIHVGDPAVIEYPFQQVNDNTLTGKAFDDRAGCAVAVQALQQLQNDNLPWTLAVAFVVREEIGLQGARTAAYQIQPDVALALEGTIAADVPGVSPNKQPTGLGKGPAISIGDRSFIVPRKMVIFLEELAQNLNLSYQHKTPLYGGTDAGAIHESREGVMAGIVSVPCRYIHAPLSMMRLSDFDQTVQVAKAFIEQAPERFGS